MSYTENIKTPEEIEREIEAERRELDRTMGDINDRFSTDGMMRSLTDGLGRNGAELTSTITRVARDHPVAVALTGIGLAWLAVGASRSSSQVEKQYDRYGYRTDSGWHDIEEDDDDSPWTAVSARAERLQADAGEWAEETRQQAASRWERAKMSARGKRAQMKWKAAELRDRIAEGTSELSDEARRRVVAARQKAYEAQVKAEYLARKGADKASGMYDSQPLVAGALAAAVGAAIGGLLPRTEQEDKTFGHYRDELFEEAERIYSEERAKIEHVARETGREAKRQAEATMEDVRDGVKSTLQDAKERGKKAAEEVKQTAKAEADKTDLGKQKVDID